MDPAAEWPAVACVLGAVVVAASARGRRAIPANDFGTGPNETALAPDEIVAEVILPAGGGRFGFAEVSRRGGGDFALAGAVCQDDAVAVFAVGQRPQRLREVEALLLNDGSPDEAAALAASEIVAVDDVHASAAYRRRVAAALVGRVVSRARGGGRGWS
jgi:carbon-monoxide dehydrogenase medium subunit